MGRIRRAVKVLQNTAHAPDELGENQHICQVVKVEGNLTYTCKLPTGEELKASLEKKFHDTIFIRVRGYVVVEIDEVARSKNCKVIGKIVNVVCNEKEWRQQPYWYLFEHPLCLFFVYYILLTDMVFPGQKNFLASLSKTGHRVLDTRCHPVTQRIM